MPRIFKGIIFGVLALVCLAVFSFEIGGSLADVESNLYFYLSWFVRGVGVYLLIFFGKMSYKFFTEE